MKAAATGERRIERPAFGLGGIAGDLDIKADRKERSDELGGKSPVVACDPPAASIRSGFGAHPICAEEWCFFAPTTRTSLKPTIRVGPGLHPRGTSGYESQKIRGSDIASMWRELPMKTACSPKHTIPVRTYAELDTYLAAFSAGHLNLLILLGGPGLSKSRRVRNVVGDRACWIEGNATAFGMYMTLWEHKDKLVIIDDVDNLYSDRNAVRLLKCLCQTDPQKQIAWHSGTNRLERAGIPKSFETGSRVALIANDWKTLNGNVEAVQDRGHVIVFEPDAAEVHGQVAKWFGDQEIFAWFEQHLHLIHRPSMRHYVRAAELKKAGLNWMQAILSDALSEKTVLVAQIKADTRYGSERDRIDAFRKSGGGCRATYFNHAKRLNGTLRSSPSKRI